jgi:Spy/CpxP family protein refolding chaperone
MRARWLRAALIAAPIAYTTLAATPSDVDPHAAHSAYASLQTRPIKALSDEEVDSLREGRGASLALPAELNGYPGPLHTLQLAEELRLTAEQKDKTATLFRRMRSEAQALGAQLIAAEAELDRLFAQGKADSDGVREATQRAATLQGALRNTHLQYHIAMRNLLTPEQVAGYARLRGYVPK